LCGHNVAPSQKENTTPQASATVIQLAFTTTKTMKRCAPMFVNDYWWRHHYEKSNVYLINHHYYHVIKESLIRTDHTDWVFGYDGL